MVEPVHVGNYPLIADLRSKEHELDRAVLRHPAVQAQRVEVELIKNLRENAPWMIPLVL